jgi:Zn-dependent protease
MQDPFVLAVGLAIFVMSVVAHEVAHGWVAYRCGDPTAKEAGRLTFNPLPHIDLFMTVFVPALFLYAGAPFVLGGAKPVPVNPFLLRRPRRDWLLVSAAGVMTNLLIAVGLALVIRGLLLVSIFSPTSQGTLALEAGMMVNVFLAVFNLVPIPPLDGSRILSMLFPKSVGRVMEQLEPVGFVLLILALYFTPLVRYLAVAARYVTGVLL